MTRWVLVAVLAMWCGLASPCVAQEAPQPAGVEAPAGDGTLNAAQQAKSGTQQPRRRGKKAEEAFVVLVVLPGALVLFLCPVGLALQCLVLGYGPRRGAGLLAAQEGRLKTAVLGVANTVFLLLVASAAEGRAPAIVGLAWGTWLCMAFLGLHGIARGIGERVLGRPPVLAGNSPLKPLALGWCILVAASAMPIVGWCMGLYWLVRGSGSSVLALVSRKTP